MTYDTKTQTTEGTNQRHIFDHILFLPTNLYTQRNEINVTFFLIHCNDLSDCYTLNCCDTVPYVHCREGESNE